MNLDKVSAVKAELTEAIRVGNTEEFVDKMTAQINAEVAEETEKKVAAMYDKYKNETDERILASRGLRVLTSEEKDFYGKVIESAKGTLTNFEVALPKTTESKIFEDIEREHELLNAIDFVNSKGLTEWLINKNLDYAYSWGDLNDEVTQEAKAAFAKVEFSQFKLSSWIPVPNTMLDLGMVWLDQFVTRYLSEIIARALEKAIIKGNGQKQPVGMIKIVDVANQSVPAVDKEATKITDLDTTTFGQIVAKLTDNGKRKVSKVAMICNPLDYWEKVFPAIFYTDFDGKIKQTNLPLTVYQSAEMDRGKAIFGLPERYFATAGFGATTGKVGYSDHFKYLSDVRTYKARCVAYGTPKDNSSFYLYDISELNEAAVPTRARRGAATESLSGAKEVK